MTKVWEYYSSRAFNRILQGPQEQVWSPSLWERPAGSQVLHVVFLLDGEVLASGCDDGTIRLWDSETGMLLGEPLIGHNSTVLALASSPDGKTLASVSWNGPLCLWDAESGDLLSQSFAGRTAPILSFAFSSDDKTLISVSRDGTIRFWDCKTGLSLGPPVTFCSRGSSRLKAALSSDAKVLASAMEGDGGGIRLFDAEAGTPLAEPLGNSEFTTCLAVSLDGTNLASGEYGGAIVLWDLEARTPIHFPLSVDACDIYVLAFSPDGGILASGSSD